MNRSEFLGALTQVLDRAIEADGAGFGNIQRVVPGRGVLEIVVQRGFDQAFLQVFKFVSADHDSACGRALRFRKRVVIADINADPWFSAYARTAADAGYRAVQSTPIIRTSEKEDVLGVLSTHFRDSHHLTRNAADALDQCAREAALIMMEYDGAKVAI